MRDKNSEYCPFCLSEEGQNRTITNATQTFYANVTRRNNKSNENLEILQLQESSYITKTILVDGNKIFVAPLRSFQFDIQFSENEHSKNVPISINVCITLPSAQGCNILMQMFGNQNVAKLQEIDSLNIYRVSEVNIKENTVPQPEEIITYKNLLFKHCFARLYNIDNENSQTFMTLHCTSEQVCNKYFMENGNADGKRKTEQGVIIKTPLFKAH